MLYLRFEYPGGNISCNPKTLEWEAEFEEGYTDKGWKTYKPNGWHIFEAIHKSVLAQMRTEHVPIGTRGRLCVANSVNDPYQYFDVELRRFKHPKFRNSRRKREICFRGKRMDAPANGISTYVMTG